MFENESLSDFKINSGDDKTLVAHKVVLAARSPVFYAMLTNDLIEAKESVVNVPDFDSKVMKEVLRFIYCNTVEGLTGTAPDLIYAAEKYQIEDLKNICIETLTATVTVSNVLKSLVIADQVDSEALFNKCLKVIVG